MPPNLALTDMILKGGCHIYYISLRLGFGHSKWSCYKLNNNRRCYYEKKNINLVWIGGIKVRPK